jgi:hypothetical protein
MNVSKKSIGVVEVAGRDSSLIFWDGFEKVSVFFKMTTFNAGDRIIGIAKNLKGRRGVVDVAGRDSSLIFWDGSEKRRKVSNYSIAHEKNEN